MSASLTRRLEAAEAKLPGAVLPQAFVWRRNGMSPSEAADWETDLAERQAASPRQTFMVIS
jgi:hypothetical protein